MQHQLTGTVPMSASALMEPYKLPTHEKRLGRAISEYLHISRNPQLYWDSTEYLRQEQVAWDRLQAALNEQE